MYRVVLLVLFVVSTLANPDMKEACHKLHPGLMRCCNKMFKEPPAAPDADLKECFEKPKSPPTCDMEECLAKKLGYYGADGKIDKDGFVNFVDKKFVSEPEFVDLIKENCVNDDISEYGPPEMCDYLKMKLCFHKQLVQSCPEWSDEGECKGIKDIVKECQAE